MSSLRKIDSLLKTIDRESSKLMIAIGSTNPTKIKSVEMAVAKLYPSASIEYKYSNVQSGVSDQPKSSSESLRGAINRAKNIIALFPDCDYGVGLEGGIECIQMDNNEHIATDNIYLQSGWIAVIDQNNEIGIGTSARAQLSDKLINIIDTEKKELGTVIDDLMGEKDLKTKGGYFGLITNEALPRHDAYHHGVMFAFSKFVSPPQFWS